MPKGIKIAFFLPALSLGGIERITLNLAAALLRKGMQIDLVLSGASGEFADSVPAGAAVHDLKSRSTIGSLFALVRYLKINQPDVVISGYYYASVVLIWAVKLARVKTKLVVVEHSFLTRLPNTRKVRVSLYLAGRFYRAADALIAVSAACADSLSEKTGIARDRVQVIYNPIVSEEFTEQLEAPVEHSWFAQGEPPVIIAVGRLAEEKGFDILIDAFALVSKTSDARLLIAGEGPERPALQERIDSLGLTERVQLPGFVKNCPAYISKSALFVLSSYYESLPTVVVEALAAGTSIVATDCSGGLREILITDNWARIVKVGDSAALAEAITESLKECCPAADTERVDRFQESVVVEQYCDMLNNIIGAGKRI